MRKIWISPYIERIAEDYRDEVLTKHSPLSALKDLYESLTKTSGIPHKAEYCKYVQRLCYYFVTKGPRCGRLLCLKPSKWKDKQHRVFNIVQELWMKETFNLPGKGTNTFHGFVTEALGYKKIRNEVLRKYVSMLGIKACYYCNAQYTISAEDYNGDYYANYELDHCMPGSKYPFLNLCFYNLHPSCPTCNKRKSDTFMVESMYEEKSGRDINPFFFALDRKSIIQYMLSNNKDDLKITFSNPSNPTLATDYETHFHINTIYSQHKDVAEELIWKARCYRDTDIDALYTQYNRLFSGKTKEDFKRMLYGHHILPSEIHKRPLNKMLRDIAKQLGILDNSKH